jgi:prepilin-type N-terminal cleavage/methylation domain-containing protein
MKSIRISHFRQAGLTLIEMVIALSIVVLIVTATVGTLDQQARKAEMLQAKLQIVQAGVLRLQADIPCGVTRLSALIRREDAGTGLCGETNNLERWHGPYIDSTSMFVNQGNLDVTPIIPGASISIVQEVIGAEVYTLLRINDITDEVRSAMIQRCGDDCIPFKNITNDQLTVGLMVSKTKLQALPDQSYDVAPLTNVCQQGATC